MPGAKKTRKMAPTKKAKRKGPSGAKRKVQARRTKRKDLRKEWRSDFDAIERYVNRRRGEGAGPDTISREVETTFPGRKCPPSWIVWLPPVD